MSNLDEWNKKLEALKALIANYDAALELIKMYRLTKPDQLIKAGYILAADEKIREALAANPCLEETENCQRYKFGSCMFLSNVTGKCMQPPETR